MLAALAKAGGKDHVRLVFPRGRYDFYRNRCNEHLLYTSNNDSGLKRIGLPLMSLRNIEIDGQGSQFIFHGRMVPLAVWDCDRVTIRDLSIDWEKPFTLEAEVLDQHDGHVDLKMSPATPYVIRQGRLSGLDDDAYRQTHITFIEFDPQRQEFVYDSPYPWGRNVAVELEPGIVRVSGLEGPLRIGRTVCMRMELRHSPGISIGRRRRGVALEGVSIHASAGIGLIVQESRDIRVSKLRITAADRQRPAAVHAGRRDAFLQLSRANPHGGLPAGEVLGRRRERARHVSADQHARAQLDSHADRAFPADGRGHGSAGRRRV